MSDGLTTCEVCGGLVTVVGGTTKHYEPVNSADRIEHLEAERDAKQARIDELMLEYCPDEMTTEQLEEWGEHQTPVING